jgi:hypothetical protein
MNLSWYKKAGTNPWSIFEHLNYDRDKGQYYSVVINYSSLIGFTEEITNYALLVKDVSRINSGYSIFIDFKLSDYDNNYADTDDEGEKLQGLSDEMDRLQALTQQVADSLSTLGNSFFRLPVHKEYWWSSDPDPGPRCKMTMTFHFSVELVDDN